MKLLPTLTAAIGLSFAALAAAVGLAFLVSANAARAETDTAAAGQCFRLSQIRGQRADGDKALYLRTGPDAVFRIDMKGRCPSLATNTDGLVMTPAGGNDLICSPLSLDLKVRNGSFATPCLIDRITRLTPAETAALPKKVRP